MCIGMTKNLYDRNVGFVSSVHNSFVIYFSSFSFDFKTYQCCQIFKLFVLDCTFCLQPQKLITLVFQVSVILFHPLVNICFQIL